MAGSRSYKIGSIFSRVTGLIRTGALTQEEKPIWYDVMAAFPPKVPPVYHQCPQDVQVADIIYKEDLIRAKYYELYGNKSTIDLTDTKTVTTSQRFIKKFLEIENDPERATEDTYNTVVKKLGAEGFNLKSIEEMKRAREEAQLAAQRHRRNLEIEQQKKLEEMSRQSFEEFSQEEDEEEVIDIDLYIDKTKD